MLELRGEFLSVRCIWLYVIIISCTRFGVNLHSIVCLSVKELLARSMRHIWSCDSNGIRTHNHLVCKQTLNHLAKLAYFWLFGQTDLALTFRQTIECRFTLKLVSDMIITYSPLLQCLTYLHHFEHNIRIFLNIQKSHFYDCTFLSCHVRVSEWIHSISCLNVKELLARSRRQI